MIEDQPYQPFFFTFAFFNEVRWSRPAPPFLNEMCYFHPFFRDFQACVHKYFLRIFFVFALLPNLDLALCLQQPLCLRKAMIEQLLYIVNNFRKAALSSNRHVL